MGAMSTSWKCDLGSALGMPPTSLISKPSLDTASVLTDVIGPLPVGKQLDSLDQACWVAHKRVEVVGGIVVDEAEGHLDALGVDEIGAGGQGNAGHAGSCGRDRAQGAWEILNGVRRP